MSINKKMRIRVHQKYNGHCSYCGKEIKYEEMQVDHLWPKAMRRHEFIGHDLDGKPLFKDPDRFENLMPSCRRCNHYKRDHELNQFRGIINTLHERIAHSYIAKVALDFRVMEFHEFEGLFYFEKVEKGIIKEQ